MGRGEPGKDYTERSTSTIRSADVTLTQEGLKQLQLWTPNQNHNHSRSEQILLNPFSLSHLPSGQFEQCYNYQLSPEAKDDEDIWQDILAIIGKKLEPSNHNQGTDQGAGPFNLDSLGYTTPQLIHNHSDWSFDAPSEQNIVPNQAMTGGQNQFQFQGQHEQTPQTYGTYNPFEDEVTRSCWDQGPFNYGPGGQQQSQVPQVPTQVQGAIPGPSRGPRRLRLMPKPIPPSIEVHGISINQLWWAKAMMEPDHVKCAIVLFNNLFTAEEVATHTYSGRGNTKPLDPQRIQAIEMAVSWMRKNRLHKNPYAFDMKDAGSLTTTEKDEIKNKVFVERRNDRKRRYIEKTKAKTTKKGLAKKAKK